MVGTAANPSLTIANIIATSGLLVTYQSTSATAESAPQSKSKEVCFQYASLLRKDEMKIRNGQNPDINTGNTAQPTPSETAADVAMNGATDHMNQVTRLGLVSP